MKVEIKSDVFDIVKRVKEIDEGYYILFDTSKQVYELHYKNQPISYCFTYINKNLDFRFIEQVYYTNINRIDIIIDDIDKNNMNIESEESERIKDYTSCVAREIYNYSANSSKDLNNNGTFLTVWR